jgi:uncharacterized protein involved in type VI secretion and phage assembly
MTLERIVAGTVERIERRFYGKYRAFVVDNKDPKKLGRIQVAVPDALDDQVVIGWAAPCVPFGGADNQGFLFVPEKDSHVWIEFLQGDLEFPVWVGTWWAEPEAGSELPRPVAADGTPQEAVQDPPTRKIITTRKGHTIQFEDKDGEELILIREGEKGHLITMDASGITLVDADKNSIVLSPEGITVTDAKKNVIEMTGDAFTITSKVPFKIDAAGQPVSIVGATIDFEKG